MVSLAIIGLITPASLLASRNFSSAILRSLDRFGKLLVISCSVIVGACLLASLCDWHAIAAVLRLVNGGVWYFLLLATSIGIIASIVSLVNVIRR